MLGRDYLIREANNEDIEAMVDLLKMLFTVEADFPVDQDKQRRGLTILLGNGNCRVMVAEFKGRVVGMCTGQILVSTAEGGLAVVIEDLIVDEQHRGRGVGKSLLTGLEEWAFALGAKRLQLVADKNNSPALVFYEKMKWHQTQLICLHKKRSD